MILLCAQRERERKYIVFLLALLGLLMREEMEEPGEPGHLQHAAAPPWSPGERPTDRRATETQRPVGSDDNAVRGLIEMGSYFL